MLPVASPPWRGSVAVWRGSGAAVRGGAAALAVRSAFVHCRRPAMAPPSRARAFSLRGGGAIFARKPAAAAGRAGAVSARAHAAYTPVLGPWLRLRLARCGRPRSGTRGMATEPAPKKKILPNRSELQRCASAPAAPLPRLSACVRVRVRCGAALRRGGTAAGRAHLVGSVHGAGRPPAATAVPCEWPASGCTGLLCSRALCVRPACPLRSRGVWWVRLARLAESEKYSIATAVGLLLFSTSVTLSVPMGIKFIIDIIAENRDALSQQENLSATATILGSVFVLGAMANAGRVYLIQRSGQRIIAELRKRVFAHVIRYAAVRGLAATRPCPGRRRQARVGGVCVCGGGGGGGGGGIRPRVWRSFM